MFLVKDLVNMPRRVLEGDLIATTVLSFRLVVHLLIEVRNLCLLVLSLSTVFSNVIWNGR